MHWIEYDVLGFEDLLQEQHVVLGIFLLNHHDALINVGDVLVVLAQSDLSLNGKDPLLQVVLRLCAQYVLPVFILYLEHVLELLPKVLKNVDLSIA